MCCFTQKIQPDIQPNTNTSRTSCQTGSWCVSQCVCRSSLMSIFVPQGTCVYELPWRKWLNTRMLRMQGSSSFGQNYAVNVWHKCSQCFARCSWLVCMYFAHNAHSHQPRTVRAQEQTWLHREKAWPLLSQILVFWNAYHTYDQTCFHAQSHETITNNNINFYFVFWTSALGRCAQKTSQESKAKWALVPVLDFQNVLHRSRFCFWWVVMIVSHFSFGERARHSDKVATDPLEKIPSETKQQNA